ncbi:hypothetical protein ACLKMY_40975, partial [Paraburkholderia mimosarum]
PEEVALASRFQYEYAEELLDVLVANYNATPHSGIGNRTPLAYAKFLYQHSPQTLRRADPAVVDALLSIRKRCIVRGGSQTGRAPFVEFYYGRYTNEVLHNRHDLVGSEIWVVCHKEDDCRVALASTLDGMSLGVLRAAPPWNISPHSLSVRAAIRQACSRGQFTIPAGGDAIEVFMRYVESHAHHRLPVHPAYLEARRILCAAADPSLGAAMLDAAKARAQQAASGASGDDSTSGRGTRSPVRHGAAAQPKPAAPGATLPPRRMAESR